MNIYFGSRANGKTMKAIQLSVEKQIPIVCYSYEYKKQIKQIAKRINAEWILPEPILAIDFIERHKKGKKHGN